MTYSTDPVADAADHYEPRFKAEEAQARAEREADRAFTSACEAGDANALAVFAPMVNDWDAAERHPRAAGAPMPKRVQTLAEVMQESLDYINGPSMTDAMQLLLNAAYSADREAVQCQAKRLIERMAEKWASQNVEVEA